MPDVVASPAVLDWLPLLGAMAAILLAGVIQASTGIGFGLVAAPVLLLVDPRLVPGSVIFLGTLVTLLAAVREIRWINLKGLAAGLSGRIPGAILAGAIVAAVSPALFQALFGLLVLAAVMLSIAAKTVRPTTPNVVVAGFVSGLMGTLTSIGAPPIALVFQRVHGPEMRATVSAFLLIGAIVSMLSLAGFGAFGWTDILLALKLVPAALTGFALSRYIIRLPDTRWLRPAVLGLCALMSLWLVGRGAMGFLAT